MDGDSINEQPAREKSALNARIDSESQWQQDKSGGSSQSEGRLGHCLQD